MANRTLDLTIISAKGLNKINLVGKMDVYAVVYISGTENHDQKQKTHVDVDGDANPTWNYSMKFQIDESAALQNRLTLVVKIKTEGMFGDKDLGEVHVPLKELIDGSGKPSQFVTYQVRKPSGKPKGELSFSYKFDEKVNGVSDFVSAYTAGNPNKVEEFVTPYPAGKPVKSDEPVTAYPAADSGSSSLYPTVPAPATAPVGYPAAGSAGYPPPAASSSAGYPPPAASSPAGYPPPSGSSPAGYPPPGGANYPAPAGYPQPQVGYAYQHQQQPGYGGYAQPAPQGYGGYPPPQPGYGGYPPPQPGYGYPPVQQPQQPKKKNKFGMGLGAGLLGGALGGLLIGDIVSDAADGGGCGGGCGGGGCGGF